MPTVEELTKQVEDLTRLVKKQSELLTKTGQQVLELQVEAQRKRVSDFDPKGGKASRAPARIDTSDVATDEDLIELVGELQGQLEVFEERTIKRLVNSKKGKNDVLALVWNHDMEEPPLEWFPRDIEAFSKIDDDQLVQLARFYEKLPPTQEERAQFEDYAEGKIDKVVDIKVDPANYTKDQLIEAFDNVARFIGVDIRRGTDNW
jgi:hypothetical protein